MSPRATPKRCSTGCSRASLRFALGTAPDRITVGVSIATLRFAEHGTVRVSAQAIIRQPAGH